MDSRPGANAVACGSRCHLSSESSTSYHDYQGFNSGRHISSKRSSDYQDREGGGQALSSSPCCCPSSGSSGFDHHKSTSSQVIPHVETNGDDHQVEFEFLILGVTSIDQKLKQPELAKSSMSKQRTVVGDDAEKNFDLFKQFDIIQHSDQYDTVKDHYYYVRPEPPKGALKVSKLLNKLHVLPTKGKSQEPQPSTDWIKRIQKEWKTLENDLPESICVRVYEDRMDLLRAVIVGPSGTPYQDGLFFFDVYFPPSYPNEPPMVHYDSRGFRLNPNLYASGKVCLSLLGTWYGRGCETWKPDQLTMLQVLVSIQGLVLNTKPYYNEPALLNHSEKSSVYYSLNAYFLTCKTMLCILHNPPKHFEDFVTRHFRRRGQFILDHSKTTMNGYQLTQLYDRLSIAFGYRHLQS